MSLELQICPFLSLAVPSSRLFPGMPGERSGRRERTGGRGRRAHRAAAKPHIDPLPAARIHRDMSR